MQEVIQLPVRDISAKEKCDASIYDRRNWKRELCSINMVLGSVNRTNCTRKFYVHVTVHRNKYIFNKTNRRIFFFPNLILWINSTCFGQFVCPSSGVFHCTFGTGICHANLMTAFKHVQLSSNLH